VKYCLVSSISVLPLLVASAFAQSTTVSINVDINGVRVASDPTVVGKDGSSTEYSQTVNGQKVPKEQVQSKVLSETATEKVTETWDRKYDVSGNLLSTERTLKTERKLPGGGTSVTESVFRADPNGGMAEKERKITETRPQNAKTTSTEITIAAPSNNGGFETIEQHKIVTTIDKLSADKINTHEDETIYHRSPNGGFVANRRTVTDTQKTGEKTEENIAKYDADLTGRLSLRNQEASTSVASKDGRVSTERSLYSVAAEGSPDAGHPKLIEQQSVAREPGANNTVKETVSVRRVGPEDRLGPSTVLSETVCSGKCSAPK
jgi:hypothetical protein